MLNYLYAELWRYFHRRAGKILFFSLITLPILLNLYLYIGSRWVVLENIYMESIGILAVIMPFAGIIFVLALVDVSFADELRLRTMKNNICAGFSRGVVYWSKIISGVVLSFLHLGVALTMFLISALLLFPASIGEWREVLEQFGLLLAEIIPLWLGVVALLYLLYFNFRSGLQAAVAVGLGTLFVLPLLQSLNFSPTQILTHINLAEWFALVMISPISETLAQKCWLVGGGYFGVCTFAGWYLFRRRDIL